MEDDHVDDIEAAFQRGYRQGVADTHARVARDAMARNPIRTPTENLRYAGVHLKGSQDSLQRAKTPMDAGYPKRQECYMAIEELQYTIGYLMAVIELLVSERNVETH